MLNNANGRIAYSFHAVGARIRRSSDAKQQKELSMEQTELIGISRRRLLAMSSVSAVATLLAGLGRFTSSGNAKAADLLTTTFRTNTSFGPIEQIDSGLLNVGYAESGPANGPPVILLHGWPYDIYSFVDVAPLLAARGYRVIVP